MNKEIKKYVGIYNDAYGGMTDNGKIIRDAWIFAIIPEDETCEGWLQQGIHSLWEKVHLEWEKYGFMVNNLPPDIRERFDRIQSEAIVRAHERGWNPENYVTDES